MDSEERKIEFQREKSKLKTIDLLAQSAWKLIYRVHLFRPKAGDIIYFTHKII